MIVYARWHGTEAHSHPVALHVHIISSAGVRVWCHEGGESAWFLHLGHLLVALVARCKIALVAVVLGHGGRRVHHQTRAFTVRLDADAYYIGQFVA